MTPEKAIERLEVVQGKLGQVRHQLICCRPPDAQVIPLLSQIAETLKSLQGERELISNSELSQKLLRDIQTRTARAGVLLESAANLFCNSTLERPLIEGSYTPDGKFPFLEFGGRIKIHA